MKAYCNHVFIGPIWKNHNLIG